MGFYKALLQSVLVIFALGFLAGVLVGLSF